jgi:diacylglycerol kinase
MTSNTTATPTRTPADPPVTAPAAPARNGFLAGRAFAFRAALNGAAYVLRTQPSIWIEMAAMVVVFGAAWFFAVTPIEWALLAMLIFGIFSLEALNTAIEAVVDLVSPEYHDLARIAKDSAAGALIFAVIASLIVAGFIFLPRIMALF